jgi:hypothetical protein
MVNTRQTSPSMTGASAATSPSSSTTTPATGDAPFSAGPPIIETPLDAAIQSEMEDWDDDAEPFDDSGSQATQDTEGIDNPANSGTFMYNTDMCLVIMSTKSGGRKLCCGFKADACARPRHSDIRTDATRRGKPGIYVGIPNTSGTIFDAVLDSFMDPADQQRQRELDRLSAAAFAQSEVKARAEALHSPRLGNPSVSFDLSHPPSPFKTTPASVVPRALSVDTTLPPPPARVPLPPPRPVPSAPSTAGRVSTTPAVNRYPLPRASTNVAPLPTATPPDDLIERFEAMHANMTAMMNAQLSVMEKLASTEETKKTGRSKQTVEVIDVSDDDELGTGDVRPSKSTNQDLPVAGYKFYAVARGRTPGIFTNWKKAWKSVRGFEGALWKSFRHRRDAAVWLSKQWQEYDISSSDEDKSDSDPEPSPRTIRRNSEVSTPNCSQGTYVQIANPEHAGADPSVGKPEQLYNTSIDVESEVLGILCPKGVSKDVQRELMETAVDVVSLPGKLSNVETNGGMDQLAATLGELSAFQSRRAGIVPRDTQWQAKNRNALDRLKSLDDLIAGTEELSTQRERVMTNMGSNMCEVLVKAGWTLADSKMFVEAGLLPRIIRASMQYYFYLLLHLRHISSGTAENWKNIGLIHLEHHASQLRNIRTYAVRRSQVLLQSYTYLRDASASSFMSLKLFGKVTSKLRETVFGEHPMPQLSTGESATHVCGHCNTSSVHDGGTEDCTLKKFKLRRARAIARTLIPKINADPDNREEIVNKAIQEEEARV